MIHATITNGEDQSTTTSGNNIDEIIAKIKEYHTMDTFERDYYAKKGTLEEELKSGWYVGENTQYA